MSGIKDLISSLKKLKDNANQGLNNIQSWANPQVRQQFYSQVVQPPIQQYQQQVAFNKQNLPSPFFNNTGNNPVQWIGKVGQDIKQRGLIEGFHDLTNPFIQNRNIYPYAEPIISNTRGYVSRIPNQNVATQIARKFLGLPPTINNLRKY